MEDITKSKTIQEVASQGGKARAIALSPERRSEIASRSGAARRAKSGIPEATHTGELGLGDQKVNCSVLTDGRRVITQSSMLSLLGKSKRSGKGRKPKAISILEESTGGQIPPFIAVSNLIPFMDNDLVVGVNFVEFYHPKAGKTKGYPAEIIPQICRAYIDAERAGVLTKDQLPIAERARVIQNALATVGIVSLIDEATGFQHDREAQELQKLFAMYIAKELQPWTQKFPEQFFKNLKKIYRINPDMRGMPQFAGNFINKYVYKELSPDILEELKKANPIRESGAGRRHRHHQWLTQDIGHPALDKQIVKINTLMSISDNIQDFENMFNKSKGVEQFELLK